jgi:hypothetical protein
LYKCSKGIIPWWGKIGGPRIDTVVPAMWTNDEPYMENSIADFIISLPPLLVTQKGLVNIEVFRDDIRDHFYHAYHDVGTLTIPSSKYSVLNEVSSIIRTSCP